MEEFSFTGLGTKWSVTVDGGALTDEEKKSITTYVEAFERRFSRFLPESEVNAFRSSLAGTYTLSPELATLLARGDRLRGLTGGVYDPAVATILEGAGYGAKSGLLPVVRDTGVMPRWSLAGEQLTIDGPIAFDLGGIGKGYCIDRVAERVKECGHDYFLVDGGGDMWASTKEDGSAWRIAIEYPGKPDMAASVIELSHQGLAVSDSFRRRFGKWHHLIDVQVGRPVEHIIGCSAVAEDAWSADSMTSGLFFASPDQYGALAEEFSAQYLVFGRDGSTVVSADWAGELY